MNYYISIFCSVWIFLHS